MIINILLLGFIWGLMSGLININNNIDENLIASKFTIYVIMVVKLRYVEYGVRNPF